MCQRSSPPARFLSGSIAPAGSEFRVIIIAQTPPSERASLTTRVIFLIRRGGTPLTPEDTPTRRRSLTPKSTAKVNQKISVSEMRGGDDDNLQEAQNEHFRKHRD